MARRTPARPASVSTGDGGWITVRMRLVQERPSDSWGILILPPALHRALGGDRGRIPIEGTADGFRIRTSFVPRGGRHYFVFNRAMREATGKGPGDLVTLILRRDDLPRTVDTPPDLAVALASDPGLAAFFENMAFSHRREHIGAIEEAKKPETRARRVAGAVDAIRALHADKRSASSTRDRKKTQKTKARRRTP